MAALTDSAQDPFVALAIETDALASVWSEQGTSLWVSPALTRALDGAPDGLGALAASAALTAAPFDHDFVDAEGRTRRARSRACGVHWQGEPALLVVSTLAADLEPGGESSAAQRHQLMIENFNDILLIMDHEGIERFVSPACTRILGYRPDELLGQHGLTLVHADDHGAIRSALTAAVRGVGPSAVVEFRHLHKDGGWRWLEASGTSMLDHPAIRGVVMIARDITARRSAEAERARLEEHLRQSQKMETVGRLAGGIAHDFNNLLTAITGNLSIALEDPGLDASLRELLDESERAAKSAAHLTHQLLAFSRKQVIAPRVIELAEALSRAQNMLTRLLGEHVTLKLTVAPDLGRVKVDPGQLDQVLVNLAVNARDAMPGGGVVTITGSRVQVPAELADPLRVEPGTYARIEVTDTGVGMTHDTRAHVFEPFFTTKDVGKGTGLGLATVYGVVRQNGGSVDVRSQLGVGTSFDVYLPSTDDALVTPAAAARTPAGHETIVVVEDDDLVRALTIRLLRRFGYVVHAYRGGEEALEGVAALGEPIHLLMTDVGIGTRSRVRRRAPHATPSVAPAHSPTRGPRS